MRLTLRTLLAARDNTLESDVANFVKEKGCENSFISELMKRIETVVVDRRLGVYSIDRNDSDIHANDAACYLDNSLPPDRLADVERACLVSDIALAEVASCHEILARLLQGLPASIPPSLRVRLNSLATDSRAVPDLKPMATLVDAPRLPARGNDDERPSATPSSKDHGAAATSKAARLSPFRDCGKSQQRVFISHSTLDQEFVEREIVQLLREHDLAFWYAPTDIRTAEHWERTILQGLQSCDWFILVMSPRSAISEWVKDELHWAIKKMFGRIIPVLMETCDPFDFHIRLDRIQSVDFRQEVGIARGHLLSILQASVPDAANDLPDDANPGKE